LIADFEYVVSDPIPIQYIRFPTRAEVEEKVRQIVVGDHFARMGDFFLVIRRNVVRDVMAARIAKVVGVSDNVVDQRAYRKIKTNIGETDVLVSPFQAGKDLADATPAAIRAAISKEDTKRLLLFEYLINSEDRHAFNYRITRSGVVKGLDYEDAFTLGFPFDSAIFQTIPSLRHGKKVTRA
jgi:hypothetical protein